MNPLLTNIPLKGILIICLFISTIWFNCSEESTEPIADNLVSITGKITEFSTGLPIQGATMFTEPSTESVLSDNEGNYTISNLQPGSYTVIATKLGYDTNSVDITVEVGKQTTANLTLSILTGFITGKITDSFTGTAVSGVKVTIQPEIIDSVFSDDNGNYTIENAIPGDYVLTFTKSEYATMRIDVTVSVDIGVVEDVTLQLAKPLVVFGDSFTSGYQSSGLVDDFQLNSFPYLIAQQMGIAQNFEQPLIASPGIGNPPGTTPMRIDQYGNIIQDTLIVNPLFLLSNLMLPRPYDNLGIPGANLNDVIYTLTSVGSDNPFFDIILRNPTLGNISMLEQVIALNPSFSLIFVGTNDYFGAALNGTVSTGLTAQSTFEMNYTQIINDLRTRTNTKIVMGNLPDVIHIPFVNMLDVIFREVPVLFDSNLQPFDFGGNLFIPLLTEETDISHLLLTALPAYQNGLGIPDSASLVDLYGIAPIIAQEIVQGLISAGLNPSGIPIPQSLTLTDTEITTIQNATEGYNNTLASISAANQIPKVDIHKLFEELYISGIEGASGQFVFIDRANTSFSLDGVYPSNAGYALMANEFIKVMNQNFGLNIPLLNVSQYLGQYLGFGKRLGKIGVDFHKIKIIFSN